MVALTFQLFAVLAGWLEAVLYDKKGAEAFKWNEHVGMTLQRIAVVLLVPAAVLLMILHFNPLLIIGETGPAALLFPLTHDEAYNFTRLWLKFEATAAPGEKSFKLAWQTYQYGYQSDSTTARNDFNGKERTWMAVFGGLVLVGLYLIHFLT